MLGQGAMELKQPQSARPAWDPPHACAFQRESPFHARFHAASAEMSPLFPSLGHTMFGMPGVKSVGNALVSPGGEV